jgi:hypothetical protein
LSELTIHSAYSIQHGSIDCGHVHGLTGVGFSAAVATEILVAQGYDSIIALAELTIETIKDLIATLRKPGGTIPNRAIPAIPATIPNPGINVGPHAATNLKLGAFVARYYQCMSRANYNPVAALALNNLVHLWGSKMPKMPTPTLTRLQSSRRLIGFANTSRTSIPIF